MNTKADIAINLSDKGLIDESITVWEDLVRQHPDDNTYRWSLSYEYFKARRYVDCINLIQSIVSIDRHHCSAFCTLGLAYKALGSDKDSLTAFLQAIAIQPTSYLYTLAAKQYYILDDMVNAVDFCNLALQLDDKYSEAWHIKAAALEYSGNYSDAVLCYNKVIDIDGHRQDIFNRLSACYRNMGFDDLADQYKS